MADVIDLRDRGEQGELGGQLAQLFQNLAMRLDPDSALRRILFPASYGERVAREVVRQAPPATTAQALTQDTRRAVAQERALPLDEEAGIGATVARAEGATSQLSIDRATRDLAVLRELGKILPPEELAKFQAEAERAGGATSEATRREAQRRADTLRIAEEMGFDATDDAERAALEHAVALQELNVKSAGLEFDEMGMRNFIDVYASASPKERRIITTGLMGPRGALFGQFLLQEEAFNRESSLVRLRASLENAKTPAEILQAQFEYKTAIRKERDRIIDRIRESEDTERPALIEDMNDLANDMLRADPTTFAMIASGKEEIFGKDVGKVEFDVTDIVREQSDVIDVNARILAQEGINEESYNIAVRKLRESLTDTATGVVNDKVFLATLQLAEGYRNEIQDLTAEDATQKALEDAWMAFMENPQAVNEARRAPKSPQMEQELTEAIVGTNASPAQVADMVRRIQRMKSFEYYIVRPDAAPPMGTPPPAAQRSMERQQQGGR